MDASSEVADARSLAATERGDTGSPLWPTDADTDSGIVQEWSDTGSVSDTSCVRHYQPQPCQMLSSWRKATPRVRSSLSPIFQYKPKHIAEIDRLQSTDYETLWPVVEPQPVAEDVVDFHKAR